MSGLYAVLEIGTTRTVLAAAEPSAGDRMKVVRYACIPSAGVRKSQILGIGKAAQSVKSVLRAVERGGEADDALTIGNAFLVATGRHVKADPYQGVVQVEGARVGNADIEAAVRSSRTMPLPKDRELLDIADRTYSLDSLCGITSPRGMSGRILRLDTLQIHADANRLNDARTAAGEAHLELRDPLFAPTCAAEAVTSEAERRDGVLVLDFGGGSTGYAVYAGGCLCAAGAIGVGGDHVTNDIAHAFQTTYAQAEILKKEEACAMPGSGDRRVTLRGDSPLMAARTLSRNAIDTVVNARMKELLTVLGDAIGDGDLLQHMRAGVVATGGGSALKGLFPLVESVFGLPVRAGKPLYVDGFENEPNPASLAAVAGALSYAHRNYEQKSVLENLIKGIFGK